MLALTVWVLLSVYLLGFAGCFIFAVIAATPFKYEEYKRNAESAPGRSSDEPISRSDWRTTVIYMILVPYIAFAAAWPLILYIVVKDFWGDEKKFFSKPPVEKPKRERLPIFFARHHNKPAA